MTGDTALRQIRELAKDSSRVIRTTHARERMIERGISIQQVFTCLRAGIIIEGPAPNAHGNWQVTMMARQSGDEITCVVVIDWETRLLIVTVY